MIANSIKTQYGGPAQTFSLYSKPYMKRIDNMRMPHGYQPPKFQQFDGKSNPKQHVAHFIETCETAGTREDLLVKQFIRTLKENALDWYTDLEPESIDSWEQLKRDFLNRFYSTRPVEMCTQGMHWRLLYILQGIKPRTFEELATRAHDMELSIANRGNDDLLVLEVRKEKKEVKSTQKVLKGSTKEAMVVSTTPLKLISKEKKMEKRQDEGKKRRPTLKERQEKIYPFPDSDLPDMLDQLLEKQLIQLPESLDKKIKLELDDVAQTNHAAVIIQSDSRLSAIGSLIQFGSLEPVVIYSSPKDLQNNDFQADGPKEEEKQVDNVEEGWTLVTHRKKRKQSFSQKESDLYRTYRSKDNDSAVNILSKSTMNQLGISVEELSNSKLVIQGFNQGAQWAIGTVRLEIVIGELQASTIFHVIDSRTTYKILLGRPWIHENGIVTSTLHQCFKFYKQGIRKVDADSRPFTKAESHFADAKFYTKSEDVSETISTEVPVTKGTFKNEQEMITSKKSNKGDALNSQQNGESTTETKLRAPEAERIATLQKEVSNPPVLRYIPLSQRKKGESPFAECSKNLTVKNTEILKENFTAPLTKIEKEEAKKFEKNDLEAYLPERRIVEGFDPKAYKLMAKAGYDFTTRTELKSVKIFDERPELSPTQKKLRK
ncbi:retrotransposon protein putative ty3-gypsy sub-class [Cucumis melo var. makuwa]|uniref:Retrotransposon protein putative ty3-gypsy sub-class n=1 Tax=Cucumis melo var. makuwa TaxID=1194695 RepID=A0A5A7V5J8_CUCMM|nr:retrotransposon protein putative ty3-gypsy sub-class [Cucumis melo var. makuwa]TYK03765.1 retrotransposon protein putative ty3-gypsy sub-class [Cucumis melo var. makuwa]